MSSRRDVGIVNVASSITYTSTHSCSARFPTLVSSRASAPLYPFTNKLPTTGQMAVLKSTCWKRWRSRRMKLHAPVKTRFNVCLRNGRRQPTIRSSYTGPASRQHSNGWLSARTSRRRGPLNRETLICGGRWTTWQVLSFMTTDLHIVNTFVLLQAKLLNYFLGSNKSNINQKKCDHANMRTDNQCLGVCVCVCMCVCSGGRVPATPIPVQVHATARCPQTTLGRLGSQTLQGLAGFNDLVPHQ